MQIMNNLAQNKAKSPEVVEGKQRKASNNTENLQLKLNTFRRKPKKIQVLKDLSSQEMVRVQINI